MKSLLIALLAVIQLGVPLAMIAKYEAALAFGQEFKFRCAPVDPIDNLRGRYVALNFDLKLPADDKYSSSEKIHWALIEPDADGFAKAVSVSDYAPGRGTAIKYSTKWGSAELPFNKYFMNESLAPQAEQAYRAATARRIDEAAATKASNCYLTVKIWRGIAVSEQLYINGQPVEELLRANGK